MVPGGGVLQLRDAEPYSLETPTTVTGTADTDTGNLAGLTFSTPKVVIEREITDPVHADVTIEATFSQVAPGSGVVDSDGNVTIGLTVAVDLHIEAVLKGQSTPIGLPGDCRATPVNLILASAAPYDPEAGQVTVAAEDFTVPEVPTGGSCDPVFGDQVNEELAGAGHALSLLLAGDLPVPPPEGCDTTTTLAADPAGESVLGAELTFTSTTAAVATDPECVQAAADGKVLSGTVDFLRGSKIVGSGELDGSGQATFTTTGLPAGTHQLSARFRSNLPFLRSTATVVEHRITTEPTVSTDLPEFLLLGSATEFTYTVANSQFSADLDDVRVDLTLRSFTTEPTLERWDGAAWQPVTMLGGEPNYYAALPAFDLARGAERTEKLRISATSPPSDPGQTEVTFEVRPDTAPPAPAPTADPLGSASLTTTFYDAERRPSAIESWFSDPVAPHTVRQGETVTVEALRITPPIPGHVLKGYFEFLLDGEVMPVNVAPASPRPGEERTKVPVSGSGAGGTILMHLPPDTPTGAREITVRYSGDAVYLPSQVTWPFYVVPSRGPSYQCSSEGFPPFNWRVNVEAQANTPSSAMAGAVDLKNLAVTILGDRSPTNVYALFGMINDDGPTQVGELSLKDLRFTFSGGGTGNATGFTRSNGWELDPAPRPASDPDHVLAFDGEEGSATIDGAVGEVVPVTLETIEIDLLEPTLGIPYNFVCTPVDDPALLGEVRVAGVDLVVAPSGPVRAGAEVELTADTGNPTGAGVAEFLDGATSLGVVPVVGGVATMTTEALPVGSRSLSVRYFPQPASSMLVSSVVPFVVLPEFDCGEFAQSGSAAVVRLVYLELLERCPDQAGFVHWKGRLDGGASQAAFARSISRTPEAVGQVVDDAYETMLGRAPEASGRAFWIGRLRASGRYDGLLADLAASPEFWAKAGSTRSGFVTRVYERLLDRAPDAGGLDHWVGRLHAGASPRALVRSLANLDEPLGRLVTQSYQEILGRAPNAGERTQGIAFLRSTGDRSGLYIELIGRSEFTFRAQGFPNPED